MSSARSASIALISQGMNDLGPAKRPRMRRTGSGPNEGQGDVARAVDRSWDQPMRSMEKAGEPALACDRRTWLAETGC